MKTLILRTILIAVPLEVILVSPAQAAPEKFVIDSTHTYPFFEINHLGWSTMHGFFRKARGTATLDFTAKQGSAEIIIDANSLDTGDPARDERLRDEDFFAVAQYPTLTFKSDRFTFNGDKLVKADGQLTLRGVSQPVTLNFIQFKCGFHALYKVKYYCAGDATATLNRSDFGITAYPGAISEQVKLSIEVEAAQEGQFRAGGSDN